MALSSGYGKVAPAPVKVVVPCEGVAVAVGVVVGEFVGVAVGLAVGLAAGCPMYV